MKHFDEGQKIAKGNINDFDEVKKMREGVVMPSDEDMAAHLTHLQGLGGFAQRGRKFYRQINNGENNDDGESDESEPEN